MRVAFIVEKLGILEIFSVPILSAVAKEGGNEVILVETGQGTGRAVEELRAFAPDILAYSICSPEADKSLEINRLLKRALNVYSVFGGAHPTFFPSFIGEDGVDAICRGEGDLAFRDFLAAFGRGDRDGVPNFTLKTTSGGVRENPLRPLLEDLDSLPFPDRDLIFRRSRFLANNPIKQFSASRGCPYQCSYCFNHSYNAMYRGKGRIVRTKSVGYLFREIASVREKYPMTFIKFHDDIFGADPGWLEEFSSRYPREIGLPFLCYARPNMISDGYCRLLKKSGCHSVCIAFEAGDPLIRNLVLNRNLSDEQISEACEALHRHGLRIHTLNMLGLPGEGEAEMRRTVEMNRRLRADFADATIFQPYPGTRIAEYCRENGYLDDGRPAALSLFADTQLRLPAALKRRIYVLHRLFPLLVDHPGLDILLPLIFRLPGLRRALNLLYRLYYGYFLHRRIFASAIPWRVRMSGLRSVLFSKSRI